jgi:hypothetical protein
MADAQTKMELFLKKEITLTGSHKMLVIVDKDSRVSHLVPVLQPESQRRLDTLFDAIKEVTARLEPKQLPSGGRGSS